jgi:hypothetical protein
VQISRPMSIHIEALQEAIRRAGGTQSNLAERLKKHRPTASQQLVSYWLKNDVRIDAEWWPAFEAEKLSTRQELRPELFQQSPA